MQITRYVVGGLVLLAAIGCKTTDPKKTTPITDNNGITTDNNVVLSEKLTPMISSNQVVNGVLKVAAGQSLQINFVISNIPTTANIGVGLSQRPTGSGLTNQGRYPTFVWPATVESTTSYPVELIVRDVNECLRLGGQNTTCWLSEGDQAYAKDSRYDTAFAFMLEVGDNVDGTGSSGFKAWWEKVKGWFKRDN